MKKDSYKYYTYQLDMRFLNVIAIVLFILMIVFIHLIGFDYSNIANYSFLVLFILMFLWLILHEVLHGIGFSLFREVKFCNIVFGMALEKGVFYCMCKQKISKKVIFTSLLFPFITIGIITLIFGLLFDNALLVYLSVINIVGSVGDIVMSIYFIRCPNDVVYLDLDDCTSFTVLSKNNIDNIKVLGINLIDSGRYNDTMKAKDMRKLVISRESFVVLIILFVLILINIIGGVL